MDNPKPTFNQEQIIERYEEFVNSFMSDEKNVKRTELLPHLWTVTVPEKDFSASITCECISNFHGVEQWFAIVEEENGEKNNFLLFEEEIEEWAKRERERRGIK